MIGDAAIAAPLPKSGYAANSQAKVVAAAVVELARQNYGEQWLDEFLDKVSHGGMEKVLL